MSVLADVPQNVEALTYRGWMRFVNGDSQGIVDLQQAVKVDGTYPDVHAFLAIVLFQAGCATDAQAELQRLDALNPSPLITDQVASLRGQVQQALANPASAAPCAPSLVDDLAAAFVERGMIRLGGGQGFYGDGHEPVADVLAAGVDYLVCEALAELTLAILQKDRQRDEALGYTRDLPVYVAAALPDVLEGRTKVITNAGGINPIAAGRAVADTVKALGGSGVTVATVVGDDVRQRAADLGLPDDALFANAYLGARPIVDALAGGAQIVVTGRVADASLFVAPLVHEFGWAWDDWDRLAAGVVVGHLLECSGQVTGGNYSGAWWRTQTRCGWRSRSRRWNSPATR